MSNTKCAGVWRKASETEPTPNVKINLKINGIVEWGFFHTNSFGNAELDYFRLSTQERLYRAAFYQVEWLDTSADPVGELREKLAEVALKATGYEIKAEKLKEQNERLSEELRELIKLCEIVLDGNTGFTVAENNEIYIKQAESVLALYQSK